MSLRKPLLHNGEHAVDNGLGESGVPLSERPREEGDEYGNYQMLNEDDDVARPSAVPPPVSQFPAASPPAQQYTYQPYQPAAGSRRPSPARMGSAYPNVAYKPGGGPSPSVPAPSYSSVYGQYPVVNKPPQPAGGNNVVPSYARAATYPAAAAMTYPARMTPMLPGVEDVEVFLIAPDLPYNVPVHAAPSAMSKIVEYVRPGDMFVGSAATNLAAPGAVDPSASGPAGGGQVGDTYIVRAISLKVRSGPQLTANLLTTIKMNTQVHAKEISGDWVRHGEGWSLSRQGRHVLLERLTGPPAMNPAYQSDVAALAYAAPGAPAKFGWVSHPRGFIINARLFLEKMPMDVYKVSAPGGVHVRSAPNTTSASIAVVKAGDYVVGLDVMNAWLRHSSGWSLIRDRDSVFLTRITKRSDLGEIKSGADLSASLVTMVVKVSALNVRLTPTSDGAVAGKLAQGQKLVVLERQDSWVRHDMGWSMVQDTKGTVFLEAVPNANAAVAAPVVKPIAKPEAKSAAPGPAWECPQCTFENKGTALACEMCTKDRPILVWKCGACTFENTKFDVNAQGNRVCEICSSSVSPPFPPAVPQKPLPSSESGAGAGGAASGGRGELKDGEVPQCDVYMVAVAVNVRSRPDLTGAVNGVLLKTVMVLAFEKQDKWIRHADGWSAVRDQNGVLLERVNVGEFPPVSLAAMATPASQAAIAGAVGAQPQPVPSMYPSAAASPVVYATPSSVMQQQPRVQYQQPMQPMQQMQMQQPMQPMNNNPNTAPVGLSALQQQQALLQQFEQQKQQRPQMSMQQQPMQPQPVAYPMAAPYVPNPSASNVVPEIMSALPVSPQPVGEAAHPTLPAVAMDNNKREGGPVIVNADTPVELLTVASLNLNVRASPSLAAPVTGSVTKGTTVLAHERQGDWVRHSGGWSISKSSETGELCLVPVATEVYQCVDDKGLRVRAGPSLDAPIVSTVKHGDFLVVESRQGDWVKHSLGWSRAESQSESGRIVHLNRIKRRDEEQAGVYTCTVPLLNVRAAPNASGAVVAVLRAGMPVSILAREGDWIRHAAGWSLFEDRATGRIHMQLVDSVQQPVSERAVPIPAALPFPQTQQQQLVRPGQAQPVMSPSTAAVVAAQEGSLSMTAQQVKEQQEALQRMQEMHSKKQAEDKRLAADQQRAREQAKLYQPAIVTPSVNPNQRMLEQRRQEAAQLAKLQQQQQQQLQQQQQQQLQHQQQQQLQQQQLQQQQQQQMYQQQQEQQQVLQQQHLLQQQQQLARYQQEHTARGFTATSTMPAHTQQMTNTSSERTIMTASPMPHQTQMQLPGLPGNNTQFAAFTALPQPGTLSASTTGFTMAPTFSTPSSLSTPAQPTVATQQLSSGTSSVGLMVSGAQPSPSPVLPPTSAVLSNPPSAAMSSYTYVAPAPAASAPSRVPTLVSATQPLSVGKSVLPSPMEMQPVTSYATPPAYIASDPFAHVESVQPVVDTGIPAFVDLAREQQEAVHPADSASVPNMPVTEFSEDSSAGAFSFIASEASEASGVDSSPSVVSEAFSPVEIAQKSFSEQPLREAVDVMIRPEVPVDETPMPPMSENEFMVSPNIPAASSEVGDERDALEMAEGEVSPHASRRKQQSAVVLS